MPYDDINALGDLQRAYMRTHATLGLTSVGGDGTDVTGWEDATGNADATMATASVPTYTADPGDGNGPVARHNDENGFVLGGLVGGTNWTICCVFDNDTLSGFDNAISGTGSSAGSVYFDGTTLTIEDVTTEADGTIATGTLYRMIAIRTATNYRIWINGTLQFTTTTVVPAATPTFVTAAYGGSGAPWDGDWYTIWAFDANKDSVIADLDRWLLFEIDRTYRPTISTDTLSLTDGVSAELVSPDAIDRSASDTAAVADGVARSLDAVRLVSETISTADSVGAGIEVIGSASDTVTTADAILAEVSADRSIGDTVTVTDSVAASIGGEVIDVSVSDSDMLLIDDFEGASGPLGPAWSTFGAADLPSVTQANGRYLADLQDNTDDVTTWFNEDTGRLDYFSVTSLPAEFIFINVGAGDTPADTQTAPPETGDQYNFCGPHWNDDTTSPTDRSGHVVGGWRGNETFGGSELTIEYKITESGVSTVSDQGLNFLAPLARFDCRLIFDGSGNVTPYTRAALSSDPWVERTLPGSPGAVSTPFALGLITYSFGTDGVPHVGTCDSVWQVGVGGISLADSAGAELVTTVDRAAADTATVTDLVTRLAEYERELSDSDITVADSADGSLEAARGSADTLTADDSAASQVEFSRLLSDTDAVGDAVGTAAEYARSASADVVVVTDAASTEIAGEYVVAEHDDISITESSSIDAAYDRSATDTVAVSDSVEIDSTGLITRSVGDVVATAEQALVELDLHKVAADTIVVTDAAAWSFTTGIADAIAIADSISIELTKQRSAADNVSVSDAIAIDAPIVRILSDTLAVADVATASGHLSRSSSDTVSMLDSSTAVVADTLQTIPILVSSTVLPSTVLTAEVLE